jgi:nucleotide-binding universal stress UspA family protein
MAETAADVAERAVQGLPNAVIASVLVHVDYDPYSDNRIRIAANMASKFGATLIGVAGWVPGYEKGGWFAAELERPDERTARVLAELEKLGERFGNLARGKVDSVEWRKSIHFPRDVIAAEARAADLVVIGSHPAIEDAYHAFDPGRVLLTAGRPVLIVPDGLVGNPGQRVLVAWKDTREARHAVQSAIPYLRMAEQIVLLEIAEDISEPAVHGHLNDVAKYLLRHGIAVNAKAVLQSQGSIADQLRNIAKDEGADLIVAGAYGHTRLGEWVFGGVTRGLLSDSEVCLPALQLTLRR